MSVRGEWRWSRVRPIKFRWLQPIPVAAGLIRGLDYVTGNDSGARSLVAVERAMPLQAWGALMLAACSLTIAGLVLRRKGFAWTGNGAQCAIYLTLGVGIVQSVYNQPFLDGVRASGEIFAVAALAYLCAHRIGWPGLHRPDRPDSTAPAQRGVPQT